MIQSADLKGVFCHISNFQHVFMQPWRCVLSDFKFPVRLYAVIKVGFARFQTFSMSLCSHEGGDCQISNFQQVFMQSWRCGLQDFKLPASLCSHEGVVCQISNFQHVFMQPWRTCWKSDFLSTRLYAAMKVCFGRFQTSSKSLCSNEGMLCQISNDTISSNRVTFLMAKRQCSPRIFLTVQPIQIYIIICDLK